MDVYEFHIKCMKWSSCNYYFTNISHITLNYITSYQITSHYIITYSVVLYHILYHIVSHHIALHTDTSTHSRIHTSPLTHVHTYALAVLDEADEMLSRGFKEQIYDVNKFMPESVQCTIFSATMPLEVLEVRTLYYAILSHVTLCYFILGPFLYVHVLFVYVCACVRFLFGVCKCVCVFICLCWSYGPHVVMP